jgi:hypothetical protein
MLPRVYKLPGKLPAFSYLIGHVFRHITIPLPSHFQDLNVLSYHKFMSRVLIHDPSLELGRNYCMTYLAFAFFSATSKLFTLSPTTSSQNICHASFHVSFHVTFFYLVWARVFDTYLACTFFSVRLSMFSLTAITSETLQRGLQLLTNTCLFSDGWSRVLPHDLDVPG